jgi:hypothetical protein
MKPAALLLPFAALGACGTASGPHATLYRSSTMSDERVHWASFNARQSGSYNRANCEMAADLLNRNLKALNGASAPVHFWCEEGDYR